MSTEYEKCRFIGCPKLALGWHCGWAGCDAKVCKDHQAGDGIQTHAGIREAQTMKRVNRKRYVQIP